MKLVFLITSLLVAILLITDCTGTASLGSPTDTPAAPTRSAPVRSAAPNITLEPATAPVGSTVTVNGSNFPPGAKIYIHLGEPNTSPDNAQITVVSVSDDGTFVVPATLPATWQNGEPIKPAQTVLVAANEDFSIKATAPLALTQ